MLGKCYQTASGNIGAENYFYELRDLEDAPPELGKNLKVFEELFGIIETSISPIIAAVNSFSAKERYAVNVVMKARNKNELARFLAYQFARNPATREVVSGFNNATGKLVHEEWLRSAGVQNVEDGDIQALQELGLDYKKLLHMQLLTNAMPRIIGLFCTFRWQLAFAPTSTEFITSDLAVVPLSRRPNSKIIDFCLPLGPRIAFVITNRSSAIPYIWKCTEAEANAINELQLEHSVQQIYQRPQLNGEDLLVKVKPEWKIPIEQRYADDDSPSPEPWWLSGTEGENT